MGSLQMTDSAGAIAGSQIPLSSFIYSPVGALTLQSAGVQGASAMLLTYSSPAGTLHVTLAPFLDGAIASVKITADAPIISSIGLSQWPASLGGRDISIPYYSQAVRYVDSSNLFVNVFLDPFVSNATTFWENSASYVATTTGSMNKVQETLKFAVSTNIMNVLPYPEHPASPYMSQMAGRLVLDVQDGQFADIASSLQQLADYGVSDCAAIVHVWQRYGYDNELPAHYSANPTMGGDASMKTVGAAAGQAPCLFALHQNYADYYPNYPAYTAAATALQADGSQIEGWLNPTTNVQAFVTKPNLFVTNAATQSPTIHQAYATTAGFIDVNSSATPWWRVDMDGSAPGAGMFGTYRDASTALWAYERQVENGPIFGEGNNHWFWSGLLDGVEAQFGSESTPITDGMQAPLFVDFDLTRIHPLQVNFGMGFYERWMANGATLNSTAAMDAYRMQEIVFGHAPFLSDALWSSVPRALLEQGLVSPIAAREALQTATKISYDVQGAWVDASAAAKANDFSIVQVQYANGDTFVANSKAAPLNVQGITVPQYGWIGYGSNFVAGSALLGGMMLDLARTDHSIYANARNQADLLSEGTLAAPEVVVLAQAGARAIRFQLAWNSYTPDPNDSYQSFIHFVNASTTATNAGIVAATSDTLAVPSTSWTVGQRVVDGVQQYTLPASMPDGVYSVRVGLYDTTGRANLYGNNDGTGRYIVGNMTVANSGATITFSPTPVAVPNTDSRMNTGQVADFGVVRTDGMLSIQLEQSGANAGRFTMRTYPRYRDVVTQVSKQLLAMPTQLSCADGSILLPSATSDGAHWQVDLRGKKYCTWHY
ncbi:hypothetical protein [Acidipila sp. EB88]|uniref:hypothetical protein n=1 Tax=Acidipila sp. EB88 TaxID=2305226 RepID=UPI000F5DF05B|nr:hypothetical protein [Acidipila sp. EB88]RRA48238.1 hypothetical protein D1Y84_07995 [Acidipila sp. EB88]